jgi:DNA polymerase II large subunit
LGTVSSIETDDLNRFGRIRDAREKELRDPDDVSFTLKNAEKKLGKQRKKRRFTLTTQTRETRLFRAGFFVWTCTR